MRAPEPASGCLRWGRCSRRCRSRCGRYRNCRRWCNRLRWYWYDRMSVLMKVSRSILRMQRGLLAWGGPFLSAGDETWMRVAKFSLDWM